MLFHETDPDENFSMMRMESEGGAWELGYHPVMFGVRLRIGRVGDLGVQADLCCGADPKLRAQVLLFALTKLEPLAEDVGRREVAEMFPYPKIKPLHLDPEWVERLGS